MSRRDSHSLYSEYVNPGFVQLLEALDYGRTYVRAQGAQLWDAEGGRYTDFLAGFGVHNIGHNHPRLIGALHRELDSMTPSMLNIDAPRHQAELAEKLCRLTHPELCRAFFANSGAEAVEMAVKTARAATGRTAIISCRGAYHGLTMGALALTDAPAWRRRFEPLPGPVEWVPFGDAEALQQVCARVKPAAFIVEPIQGEGGVNVPGPEYLAEAAAICRRAGALLIVDEIQTGLGRTGKLFATPFDRMAPDILLLGKALSGGVIPIALGLARSQVWDKAFGTEEHCNLNASTFGGGLLACTAAKVALEILQEEDLAQRAVEMGAGLTSRLKAMATRHAAIREVRGEGLLIGVELEPPAGLMMRAAPAWARDGLQAHVICALLLRDHGIIAQPCSLRQNVLRVEPPLMISESKGMSFVSALDQALDACPTPRAALKMAFCKRVLGGAL